MQRLLGSSLLLAFCAYLSACSIAPTHPSLSQADLPELVPVRDFVANTDSKGGYQISPDGETLAWRGVSQLRPAILWRDRTGGSARALRFKKYSPWVTWASDSQHILFHSDPSGRENHHIIVFDTNDPETRLRDLTPYPGVKAFIARVPSAPGSTIFIMHNRRDPAIFDLYKTDIITGEETLLYQNDESIIHLLLDDSGVVRARVRQTESERLLESVSDDGEWRVLIRAGKFDNINPIDVTNDGASMYLLSNVGRDKRALTVVDLKSGDEEMLFEHDRVDFGGVIISSKDRRPLAGGAVPDYPEIVFFDKALEKRLQPLLGDEPAGLFVMSIDREERYMTVSVGDHTGARFYLLDLIKGTRELLAESASRQHAASAVEHKPITVTASDGMQLHGYLSLPKIAEPENLPTVLLVHGGPWARDWWGFHTGVQFFANRGYAVIQINYRGSRGYGRHYMHAANGEFAGKMHQDLIDAVDWAIEQNISDPTRIAIVGGSYGGYATLVGMTMTPGKFACGVDNVGVSDLATLLEDAPPYWKPWMHFWHRFVGDPADPEQRKILDAKSPLNYAHQMEGPLLVFHGVNDPRVKIDQSDRMVAALRAADKDVEYIVIEDEGHGYGHWKNQLSYYRKVEDFLAECLGGRSSGFDYYQLGSWAF